MINVEQDKIVDLHMPGRRNLGEIVRQIQYFARVLWWSLFIY